MATHVVGEEVAAWDRPDPGAEPVASLWAGMPVVLLDRQGGWARVRCENGWETWTDAERLTADPSGATDGVAALLNEALGAYRLLIDDHEAGRIDEDTFRRQAFKTALIVRETDAWLLDLPSERWWRYDGIALSSTVLRSAEPKAGG